MTYLVVIRSIICIGSIAIAIRHWLMKQQGICIFGNRFPYTQQHSVWNCYLSINGFAVFSKDFAPVESLGVGTGGVWG